MGAAFVDHEGLRERLSAALVDVPTRALAAKYKAPMVKGRFLTEEEAFARALEVVHEPKVWAMLGRVRDRSIPRDAKGRRKPGPAPDYTPEQLLVAALTLALRNATIDVRQTDIAEQWDALLTGPHASRMRALAPNAQPDSPSPDNVCRVLDRMVVAFSVGDDPTEETIRAAEAEAASAAREPGEADKDWDHRSTRLRQRVSDLRNRVLTDLLSTTLLAATAPSTPVSENVAADTTVFQAQLNPHRVHTRKRHTLVGWVYGTPSPSHEKELQLGWNLRLLTETSPRPGHVAPPLILAFSLDHTAGEGAAVAHLVDQVVPYHPIKRLAVDRGVNVAPHEHLDPTLNKHGITKVAVPMAHHMGVKTITARPGTTGTEHILYIDGLPYVKDIKNDPKARWNQSPPRITNQDDVNKAAILAQWEKVQAARALYRLHVHTYRGDRATVEPAVRRGQAVCKHNKKANRHPRSTNRHGRPTKTYPQVQCTEIPDPQHPGKTTCTQRRTYTVAIEDFPLGLRYAYGSKEHQEAYGSREIVESHNGTLRTHYGFTRNTIRTLNQAKAAILMAVYIAAANIRALRMYTLKRGKDDPWVAATGTDEPRLWYKASTRRTHTTAADSEADIEGGDLPGEDE